MNGIQSNGGCSFTCFLIGDGTLLRECADILRKKGHRILAVVVPEGPQRKWVEQAGLEVIDPASDYGTILGARAFDYLFSINYLRKIPEAILKLAGRCAINFHDGPLPRYAGLNTPAWALINQEQQYGICWHRMTAAIDAGPVLKRGVVSIEPGETAVSLNTKCLGAAVASFAELTDELASGHAIEEPQTTESRRYFGRYDRPAAAALLDWSRPADELDALIRGLQFGAYANPLGSPKLILNGTPYIIASARLEPSPGDKAGPGHTLRVTDQYLRIATGDGAALDVREITDARGHAVEIGRLEMQLGHGLTLPARETFERLGALDSILCRSESFWSERLATLRPIAAPLSRALSAEDGSSSYIRRLLRLPTCLTSRFAPGVTEATLLSILLARLERQPEFDLALTDAKWSERIRGLENLIAEESCCRIRVAPDQNFAALAEVIGAELSQLAERGAWLHDLFARQPSLRAVPQGTSELPVGIALGQQPDRWLPTTPRALTLVCSDDGLSAALVGDTRQFSRAALETLGVMFETLASGVAAAGQSRAEITLPLVDQETSRRIMREWNQTDAPSPPENFIHLQIEKQAERTPDETALVFADSQITYRVLNERANKLAARLIEFGVGPERLVGVHLARSVEMVVAVLAVLKAGGAYVPLDPAFPIARICHIVEDCEPAVILTQKEPGVDLCETNARIFIVDQFFAANNGGAAANPAPTLTPANLAYVIYTSGSTGRPKGVMVEHRNVANFFTAMDACIPHERPGTWIAVTSLSFDISVLELLWTLARGFKVVIESGPEEYFAPAAKPELGPMGFSLFMWGNDATPARDKYRLMLEAAKYFDRNGFDAVWTPERHFHAFGGPYPNPSVTAAALAAVTERLGIRAGSCVSPLHHPIRIAEEWAVVDNLSNGRVAIAFASGWQPNDFVLRPENHARNKQVMFEQLEQVRRLWRGEKIPFSGPLGQEVLLETLPRPVQPELPVWVTTAGNPDTYRQAGELGANVLTHLLGQSVEELAGKIRIYREARAAAGHDPALGRVTLMLHTFVGEDDADVRELVRQPMKDYLRSSLKLTLDFAWAFPAFKRPGGAAEKPQDVDLRRLADSEVEAILDFAFERYFETSGLFGTPATCARMVERCKRAGVDEIACLLDFGVPTDRVLASLPLLKQVRDQANPNAEMREELLLGRFSIAQQIQRHGVTHLQCTPSLARMLLLDAPTRAAMARIRHLLVGGEALPSVLACELQAAIGGDLRNMYGPTETTVWSMTQPVVAGSDPVPIGRPIANTRIYILDAFGQPVPVGVTGELFIGGAGVARGYLGRPELTAERFIEKSLLGEAQSRLYRTGDLARFLPDGTVEFLGRADRQIKLRGYRIELDEIENLLSEHPAVSQAAVVIDGAQNGDARLSAYVVADAGRAKLDVAEMRRHLSRHLPDYMVPADFIVLEQLPLTPNGKVDRKALPKVNGSTAGPTEFIAPDTPTEKALADLWQKVLRLDRVSMKDNFFASGGHSLLAMQLAGHVRDRFGIDLPLRNLFERPTVGKLAEAIDALLWSARSETPALAGKREEVML
jgi:natural product biosynthesis luciferase-like monooxygenase protein